MKTFLHMLGCLAGLEQPESQVTPEERLLLKRYVEGAGTVVELGCFEGATTAFLCEHSRGTVHSIDPFFKGRLGIAYGHVIARFHLAQRKRINVKLIKGYSYEVASAFVSPIDFLFIDGDHSLAGVQRDWADWFPKVSVGGIVAAHDSRPALNSPTRLGSMEYYESYLVTCSAVEEVASAGSLVIFRKVR